MTHNTLADALDALPPGVKAYVTLLESRVATLETQMQAARKAMEHHVAATRALTGIVENIDRAAEYTPRRTTFDRPAD